MSNRSSTYFTLINMTFPLQAEVLRKSPAEYCQLSSIKRATSYPFIIIGIIIITHHDQIVICKLYRHYFRIFLQVSYLGGKLRCPGVLPLALD